VLLPFDAVITVGATLLSGRQANLAGVTMVRRRAGCHYSPWNGKVNLFLISLNAFVTVPFLPGATVVKLGVGAHYVCICRVVPG
jgi:hypothetical protein